MGKARLLEGGDTAAENCEEEEEEKEEVDVEDLRKIEE